MDVLDFYPILDDNCNFNEFAEVEALDKAHTDDNRKYCTKKIKIGAKLSISNFIKACVEFVIDKTSLEVDEKSSGDCAKICSSGNSAQICSSGYCANIGSSGDYAKICSSGEDSVICCAGNNSIVKAKKGSWITLAEWKLDEERQRWIPVCVKTEFVDGERIKENTWYKLENGEFVEHSNGE